jgi:hypothetical protein
VVVVQVQQVLIPQQFIRAAAVVVVRHQVLTGPQLLAQAAVVVVHSTRREQPVAVVVLVVRLTQIFHLLTAQQTPAAAEVGAGLPVRAAVQAAQELLLLLFLMLLDLQHLPI